MNPDQPAAASSGSDMSARRVADNPGKSRYEILVEGESAGFVTYRRNGDVIAFMHTEMEPPFQGAGLASHLVRETLDDARQRHLSVLPFCPYVAGWIRRHSEYADLVPADRRPDFDLA
jgi:predicted GNAT family acetyltransferase